MEILDELAVEYKKERQLRYGENPHQKDAALYRNQFAMYDPLAINKFVMVKGEGDSYINITDLNAVLETVIRIAAGFNVNWPGHVPYIAAAVKHGDVCGVGVHASDPEEALRRMVHSEPDALFGGCVMVNFELKRQHAELLRLEMVEAGKRILDVVIAPSIDEEAVPILARTNGKCRMFVNDALLSLSEFSMRSESLLRDVRGGVLFQDPPRFVLKLPEEWVQELDHRQQQDMVLGWAIASTVKSNSIVLTWRGRLIGRGCSTASRKIASRVALMTAERHAPVLFEAVAASDSFFPFSDGATILCDAGIKVIFATSGAQRDEEVAAACVACGSKIYRVPDTVARGFHGH